MSIAIAIHGGAGEDNPFLQKNLSEVKEGLERACRTGYDILKKGGKALDAVEAAVIVLENDPHFNAGRGAALNCKGHAEMDASIMDGKTLKAGAVSMVSYVKNPVVLARVVMEKTRHVLLSSEGALELANTAGLELKPLSYFITNYQYDLYEQLSSTETKEDMMKKKLSGTVGAVAVDKYKNVAAATSTGGTSNCLAGRVGDSCVIGAGCYANNESCAVSGTGEGEALIVNVVGHSIAMLCEQGMTLQEACEKVIFERNKMKGEIGVISVSPKGEIGVAFNTDVMKRAWIGKDGKITIKIFPTD